MKKLKEKTKIQCPYCNSNHTVKHSKYKNFYRFKCVDCKKTFTDKVPKYSNNTKQRALWLYLNNMGIRKIAKYLGISPPLVLY
jgi:transposase-like protein